MTKELVVLEPCYYYWNSILLSSYQASWKALLDSFSKANVCCWCLCYKLQVNTTTPQQQHLHGLHCEQQDVVETSLNQIVPNIVGLIIYCKLFCDGFCAFVGGSVAASGCGKSRGPWHVIAFVYLSQSHIVRMQHSNSVLSYLLQASAAVSHRIHCNATSTIYHQPSTH